MSRDVTSPDSPWGKMREGTPTGGSDLDSAHGRKTPFCTKRV